VVRIAKNGLWGLFILLFYFFREYLLGCLWCYVFVALKLWSSILTSNIHTTSTFSPYVAITAGRAWDGFFMPLWSSIAPIIVVVPIVAKTIMAIVQTAKCLRPGMICCIIRNPHCMLYRRYHNRSVEFDWKSEILLIRYLSSNIFHVI